MEPNTFQHQLRPGLLLVSKAEVGDPRFLTSVSLLCLHDDDGSLALILNHPLPLFITPDDFSVSEQQKPGDFPLYRGGPVGPQQCMFLFSGNSTKSSIEIFPNCHLGTDPECLKELKLRAPLREQNIKFFLGYAGWSFFQLDCETSNHWWYTHPGQPETPFKDHQNLWLQTLKDMGDEFYQKGQQFLDSDLL